ncbi:class I SAM-dependent methyltransferase [Thalassomonas haliotis]|uniref:Class I SAM-dependent methyltransferase n=1 Tax=Thalassomonas haliotis TaxID=485448 RepID=A0ABY7VEG8_9GAMM|nr:class I SAM-dependent methyltransferase [Thalassomonas haliotis]WDE12078.1 class I SAM-dependent methyltransferase [Thalassomonas haliotis]
MTNILDRHLKAYQGNNLYDFDNNILMNWYPQRILSVCENAGSLLELGIGHGITSEIFAKHVKRHLVVDASPAVIEHYKSQHPGSHTEIVESYFETFASEERFDVIVAGFVLEHVDDPHKTLSHIKQFLAPGGKMFITVPNAEVLNRRLGHLAGLLPDMQELSEHDHLCGHKRYYNVERLKQQVADAGYRLEKLEGIYLKPVTTAQMITLNFDEKIIRAFCEMAIDYPELSCALLAQVAVK